MPSEKENMEDAIKSMKLNRVVLEEAITEISHLTMHRYKALQNEGFTKAEAFQIILARGHME